MTIPSVTLCRPTPQPCAIAARNDVAGHHLHGHGRFGSMAGALVDALRQVWPGGVVATPISVQPSLVDRRAGGVSEVEE